MRQGPSTRLGNEMRDVRLSYYLGQTTITVSGTVTFHYDNVGDPSHFDRTAFISTGVGADTSQAYELVLRRRRLFRGDSEIDLSLAADGRLLGVGFEANGGGADAAGGVVAVLTLSATVATAAAAVTAAVAPVAVALFKAARGTAVDLTKQPDRAPAAADRGDGSDWGELTARAAVARKLAWDLQKRALDLARQAAGDDPPAGLADQMKTVSASLDLARAELANLQQALKGWQSRHYPDQSASFTYRLGLDELGPVDEPLDLVRKPLKELSEAARNAACTLHTIVLRVDPAAADPPATNTSQAARPAAGDRPVSNDQEIRYRAPFLAQLAIYELAQNADVDLTKVLVDQPLDWRLRQVVPIWALGRKSDEKTLDVFTPRFGRSSVQVAFGDSGAASHISVADVGPIANLSNTVSGAVQASGSGSPAPAASGSAPPAAASAGSGATQDPVLGPLQMEAAVKKVRADIAGYDKTIRDSQTDAQPSKQGGGK